MTGTPRPRVIVICGPTASGKSELALSIAEQIDGEIVGADSLQLYRYLDIGTAKPTPGERARVRHHLIDLIDPSEPFNAAQYRMLAAQAIEDIHSRGRHVLVVGGTGLYIRILLNGIFQMPEPDADVREKLERELGTRGVEYLHGQLQEVDPELAGRVEKTDKVRILRGLEVFEMTGVPLSVHQEEHAFSRRYYDPLMIGVLVKRRLLHERILLRTKRMVAAGLLDEYNELIGRGYSSSLKPLRSIGYRQMADHLSGKTSLEDAVEEIARDTRRYAKRQMTWFRKEKEIHWVESPSVHFEAICKDISSFLSNTEMKLDWKTEVT